MSRREASPATKRAVAGAGTAKPARARTARRAEARGPVPRSPDPSKWVDENQPLAKVIELRPQPGFQEGFCDSGADITIGGGAAGCGKSYAALLEAVRDTISVPTMGAVFFRRTIPEVENEGGLWDESTKIYPLLGGIPTAGKHLWRFPHGGRVRMTHLQHEDTVKNWQGSQVPLFIFDELTHFTATQFWYLLSRNRSNIKDSDGRRIRARILATCNPDADSWVADLIAWWIEQDPEHPNYGFPIKERAGKLRYFTRVSEQLIWGDTKAEVMAQAPGVEEIDVRSLTFVPGKLTDNKLGDPRYRGQLMAMSRVERARLLDGNWKIRAVAGDYYKREEARILENAPPASAFRMIVRRWDLAATEPSETNKDPDWTVGVKMGVRADDGRFVVLHVERKRIRSNEVRKLVKATADLDGPEVHVILPQDPGQAGVDQVVSYMNMLPGYTVYTDRETGDKVVRQEPFSARWQHGLVDVVRGPWNPPYFGIMEAFPTKGIHDDDVDASAGAYHALAGTGASIYD